MPNIKKLDQLIKSQFKQATHDVTSLKDETWQKISDELFPKDKKALNKSSQRTWVWTKGVTATFSGIAVATVLIFLLIPALFTDEAQIEPNESESQGQDPSNDTNVAYPDDGQESKPDDSIDDGQTLLKDQFENEKQETIELEGMEESITVQLATNEEWRYIIYIDKNRYKFQSGHTVDHIVPIEPSPHSFPEVGMEIRRHTNTTEHEIMMTIKEEIAQDSMTILQEESVSFPMSGMMITAISEDGEPGLAPVYRYYITTVGDSNIFSFKQKFFEEAWEGHAVRFDHILTSFEWVS